MPLVAVQIEPSASPILPQRKGISLYGKYTSPNSSVHPG